MVIPPRVLIADILADYGENHGPTTKRADLIGGADQDEPSEVTVDLRPMPHSLPVPAERASKQCRDFTPVQVSLPRSRLRGKRDGDEAINLPFLPTPPNSRA